MPRQKLNIPEEKVSQLAKLGATNVDIADFFGCSEATIRARFCEALALARSDRRITLRRWQWRAAAKGNVKMLMFLGQQELGQANKLETKNEHRRVVDEDRQAEMLKDEEAMDLACLLDARLARPGRNGHVGRD